MPSSLKKTNDLPNLDVSEDALDAPPIPDESPTVISKSQPEAIPSTQTHITVLRSDPFGGNVRGMRLAHFELIEPIGVGGMAAVLRAKDTQLERVVALKILPPEMATDQENISRFHQEARAAARLDHENIARVFFCGEDQRLHFIAFEYVDGENLRTVLERRGRLPVREAVRITLQIALGLEHAAERGVVHRDVKPSNIIITPRGQAKLVDMGLARSLERHDHDLTQSGITLGTFDYISPEQAMDPRDADTRSDLYSLGCTLYHMLTGQPPVPEGTAAKKLNHHQNIAPADPRLLNSEVPDELAFILSRLMAKNPRDRYQRPVFLIQHLQAFLDTLGPSETGNLPGDIALPRPFARSPRRRRPAVAILLALATLAGFLALLALLPSDNSTPVSPVASPKADSPAVVTTATTGAGAEVPTPFSPNKPIRQFKDLAALFTAKRGGSASAKLVGKIDLEERLEFKGASLELEAGFEDRAEIVLNYQGGEKQGGLVLDADQVVFRNLTFRIQCAATPDKAVAATLVRGGRNVVFDRCVFLQQDLPSINIGNAIAVAVASVLVAPEAGAPTPRVQFKECYFAAEPKTDITGKSASGGQAAIAVAGHADMVVQQCIFRPHDLLFQFRAGCTLEDTKVRINRSFAFVQEGPAFRGETNASFGLDVSNAVFSHVPGESPGKFELYLVDQKDERSRVQFLGSGNLYHNLAGYWLKRPGDITATIENFRDLVKAESGNDEGSRELKGENVSSPWLHENPLKKDLRPQQAFQLRPEYSGWAMKECAFGSIEPVSAADVRPALADNQKLVDAESPGDGKQVFRTLRQALAFAQTGDVIFLKPGKTGEIELNLEKIGAGKELTIKAFEGTAPVLTLASLNERDRNAFFHLADGKLTFERLHFRLSPKIEGPTSQSVVLLGDRATCVFKGCVVTLKPELDVPQNVVTLLDPKTQMMKGGGGNSSTMPRIVFESSLVRGKGNAVDVSVGRRLDIDLQNSMMALAGSLLRVETMGDEMTEEMMTLRLTQSSIFFKDQPMFELHAGRAAKSATKTVVRSAQSCLLASLGSKGPLVKLFAADLSSTGNIERFLDWKGAGNVYTNIRPFVEGHTPEDIPAMEVDSSRWPDFRSGIATSRMNNVTLTASPRVLDALHLAAPSDFALSGDTGDSAVGCTTLNVDALLKNDRKPE